MDINVKEMREIIRLTWSRLYFRTYGAFQEGVEEFAKNLNAELDAFEKSESEKIAQNYKED